MINFKQNIRHNYTPQFLADLVTFTEEILNGKLHFLCSILFSNPKLKKLKHVTSNEELSIKCCLNSNFYSNDYLEVVYKI